MSKPQRLACLVALLCPLVPGGRLSADIVQWDFDGDWTPSAGDVPPAQAEAAPPAFAPDAVFLTDEIGGEEAGVAGFSRGTFFRLTHGFPPNGGGAYVNRYTLIMDAHFPEGTSGWQALLQTSQSNSNDGEWFVQPDASGGGIGISGNYGGNVPDGVWHRLSLVVDLVEGTYTSYINGMQVQQNTGLALDGRFSLDPSVLIFADENEENAAGFVNSVQIRNEALGPLEIAVLGGPSAGGIPREAPPLPAPVGLWEFEDADDLTRATAGDDLVLTGAHLAVPGVLPGDGAARIGLGSHYRCAHGISPNGGGSRVNRFTALFDFRFLRAGTWSALYQTNADNANDAECFVRPEGNLGAGDTGYSDRTLEAGTWRRLAVAVDNGAGLYEMYIDGERILDGGPQAVDGRFSLEPVVLLFADDNGDDGLVEVSQLALYDRPLFPGEILRLGGPGGLDPDNRPPELQVAPAGPESGEADVEYEYTFRANDPDGDRIQFRVDWGDGMVEPWSDFQDALQPFVIGHSFVRTGILSLRVSVRDEHGATQGFTTVQTVMVTGDIQARFVTEPYLQNLRTTGITIMWELDELVATGAVDYGLDASYGDTVDAEAANSGFSTYIYKAILTDLEPDALYHFRVRAGTSVGLDRSFRTAPTESRPFSFGVWSDSQGFNHGAYPPDPLEPTKAMMAHMAAQGVDIAITCGDLAENGASYTDTRNFYLDRVAKFLGQTVPWFNAWGNHDAGRSAILRRFADMPSKERPGFDSGWGSFSFDYAGCHFICIDYATEAQDIANWLESDLRSDAARQAKFIFLFIHVPPYCELWIDGSASLRSTLVPLMEKYGVDVCFSGHTHEYERGLRNDVFYCITGGGSWLDFPERLIIDWPHMTVGGFHDLPLGIDKGLVNEYVVVEVEENSFTCSMYAFDFDGTPIGVLDGFYKCETTTGEFVDEDGDSIPDRPQGDRLCVPCPRNLACVSDLSARSVSLSWEPAEGTDADAYEIARDGEVIATVPVSEGTVVDSLPASSRREHTVLQYSVRPIGGADAELCAPLECRAFFSTGDVRLHQDFDRLENDLELEFAGWFPIDVNNPLERATWTVSNPGGRANPPDADGRPSTGRFVISDSDAGGSSGSENPTGSGMSHDLWSPVIDCEGLDAVWLHMDLSVQLNNNGKAVFDVDVSRDAGAAWSNVFRRVAPSRTEAPPFASVDSADGYFGRLHLDITEIAAGEPNARFRLRHFEPNWDWWIAVDNVVVDDVPGPQGGAETLLEEGFEQGIPASWTVRGSNGGLDTWNVSDPCNRAIASNGGAFPHQDGRGVHRLTRPFAILDSACDPDPSEDEFLITPSLDCSGLAEVYLHWKSEIVKGEAAEEVLLSLDGGETFEPAPVFSYSGGGLIARGEEPAYAERVLEVDAAAGQPNVAFAFHVRSDGDQWWWAVDDVMVTGERASGGAQLPNDCNQDGQVDLSDAVCLLGFLFTGSPSRLPCGDGGAGDPSNVALADANGDADVNLSDAIHLLSYLFAGGQPPAGGAACRAIDGCPTACEL